MSISFIGKTRAILLKDIRSELRSRYAASSILLFVLTAVTIVAVSITNETISPELTSGILWILMFFGAMTGLAKSFVTEEERGTSFLLKLASDASSAYFGKLFFNIILCLILSFFAVAAFLLLAPHPEIGKPLIFAVSIFAGSLGIACSVTIISAIIARAGSKNALFPILSFPVLFPLVLIGIETTGMSIRGETQGALQGNFQLLLAYCGLVVTVSYLLFDFIWEE